MSVQRDKCKLKVKQGNKLAELAWAATRIEASLSSCGSSWISFGC